MNKQRITTAILVFLSLTGSAFAQARPDAQELLKKVSETYRNLTSYQFEFLITQESQTTGNELQLLNRREEFIRIAVDKPDRWRVESGRPEDFAIALCDGRTAWIYAPRLRQYVRKAAAPVGEVTRAAEGVGAPFLAGLNNGLMSWIEQYKRLENFYGDARMLHEETVEVSGKKIRCYVVETAFSGSRSGRVETSRAVYWIDQTRFLVLRHTTSSASQSPSGVLMGWKQSFACRAFRINEPPAASEFTFVPPADAREVVNFIVPGLAFPRRTAANRPESKTTDTKWQGRPAPDFTLKDLEGKEVSLQSLRGKVVVLNFWATWCGPCRAEMPYLEKLSHEYKDRGVMIIGIDDEETETAREFIRQKGYTYPSLIDEQQMVGVLYELSNSIPHTFFIARDGRIAEHYSGGRSESDLRAGIEKALAGAVVSRNLTPPGCIPVLLLPKAGASLDNGRSDKPVEHFWEFDWSDCPGATEYHLYIKAPGATFALVDDNTIKPSWAGFAFPSGYVPEHRRRGWMWRVRAKVNGQWGDWSQLQTFDLQSPESEGSASVQALLPAPEQAAPAPNTVFDYYPRRTKLIWKPVPGAVSYCVEIDYFMQRWYTDHIGRSEWVVSGINTTNYTFNFMGAQPGRWRVWAVDANGRAGAKSGWWEFTYTK